MSCDLIVSRTLLIGSVLSAACLPVALSESVDLLTDSSGVRIDGVDPGDFTWRATTCDINGDGLDDLVVGANEANGVNNFRPGAGEVSVIFGRRGSWHGSTGLEQLRGIWIIGGDPGDSLGYGVVCGDVNGDGYADLVLGAPFADGVANARSGAGQIHIVFGSSTPPAFMDLLVEPSVTIVGGAEYAYIGETPAIGDLNGDGLDDIAIDSRLASDATATLDWAGRSYLVFGRTEWPQQIDLSRDSDVVISGRRADDRLSSGQSIGDVTGDGTGDLVISVPNGMVLVF
jgi:hypothetical protein